MTAATPSIGAARPTLRGRDLLALTVGIVVGAGIFRTPSLVAGAAGSEATLLIAWLAGGLLSIIGALCYAELASAYPHIGGDYHFLRRAFGNRLAFLYAWTRLTVIQTGSLALLAYVFGDYMAVLVPIGPLSSTVYAAAAVIVVSLLNWAGVRSGATAQRWLTAIEVGGLALVIIAGLLIAPAGAVQPSVTGESALGLMMVFVLLTYGGWSEAAYLSAEVKDGARRIAPMLVLGLTIVTLLYMLANLAFLSVLGLGGMAATDAVAADVMRLAFGDTGGALISLLIAIAAITSANATAITGGRTACALGRSYRGLSWLGQWDDARNTPANGLLAQCVIALLLVGAGALAQDGFRTAIEYTAPVFWGFLLLVGLSLFVLRRREPDRPRPFRVPFYPILPAVFCLTSAYLLYSSLAYTGWGALAGVAVLLGGGILLTFLTPTDNEEFAS